MISDRDINAYLQELDNKDEYLNSEAIRFPNKKRIKSGLEEVDPMIGGRTRAENRELSIKANKEKAADIAERKKEIIQEAINSKFIDLNAPLEVKHKKLLIKLMTDSYSRIMEQTEKSINAKVQQMLKPKIPHELMKAYAMFKESVIPAGFFTYKASNEYGQGHEFKVTLDLPFYFHPNDIQRVLEMFYPEQLPYMDKAIVRFYNFKEARTQREVKLADQLTRINTFYQLANKKPLWYDTLVQELKRQADEQQNGQTDSTDKGEQ